MGSKASCCQDEDPPVEVIQPEVLHCQADPDVDTSKDQLGRGKVVGTGHGHTMVAPAVHRAQEAKEEDNRPPSKRSRLQKMGHLVVDKEIIRGIELRRTFHRGGSLWRRSPIDLPQEERQQLWNLSQTVEGFDIFLSHTWQTSGNWKILALLMQSSWKIALWSWTYSVCFAMFLCVSDILPMTGIVEMNVAGFHATCPLGTWVIVFGFVGTTLGVLLSAYIPTWFSSSGTCFLDVVTWLLECLESCFLSPGLKDPELMEHQLH